MPLDRAAEWANFVQFSVGHTEGATAVFAHPR